MRTFLIALLMTFASQVVAEVNFPDTKYEISDCISPIDPTWSWFGQIARVEDIVYSKKLKMFAYRLYIPESDISEYGLFGIWIIDLQTFKLIRCPF